MPSIYEESSGWAAALRYILNQLIMKLAQLNYSQVKSVTESTEKVALYLH